MSILLELRDHMAERKRASLNELAMRFDTTPDAMRGMLDKWVQKGKVARCEMASCNGCTGGCDTGPGEIYEWLE